MDLTKGAPGSPQTFKGYTAVATLYPDRVEITRNFMAKLAGNKDTVVPLADVIKPLSQEPTRLLNGYVFFATSEDPPQLRAMASVPQKQIAGNRRSILFTWNQRDTWAKFRAAVDAAWCAAQEHGGMS